MKKNDENESEKRKRKLPDKDDFKEYLGNLREYSGEYENDEFEALSEEDFLRLVFSGECPSCGSKNTISCDEFEDIDDPTVALCEDCGFMWCTMCGFPLERGESCGHWDVCESCSEEKGEYDDCGVSPYECPRIMEWKGLCETEILTRHCAWCGNFIPEEGDVFAVGAKLKCPIGFTGVDNDTGYVMFVLIGEKKVPVIATAEGSEARNDGNDWLFIVCSKRCGLELKSALEREKEIVEKAEMN